MKPVDQRGAHDCLRACLASIFEIPYEDAPNTDVEIYDAGKGRGATQYEVVRKWLRQRGLTMWELTDQPHEAPVLRRGVQVHSDGRREPSDFVWPSPLGTYHLGGGPSPRGEDKSHAVVMFSGKIVHDPHPDRDMTIDRIRTLMVPIARLT